MALLRLSEHSGGKFSWGHCRGSASDTILKRVETGLSCVYVLSIDVAGLVAATAGMLWCSATQ